MMRQRGHAIIPEPTGHLPLARIAHWARTIPSEEAIRFLENGEEVTERFSYAALWEQACVQAKRLASLPLKGKPVVLIYDAGPDFILALLACLLVGGIAVPLPVPRQERACRRFLSVIDFLKPSALLTTSSLRSLPDLARCGVLTVCSDEDVNGDDHPFISPDITADTPAVIQFSSGSTGEPRGIVLTHGNIAANLQMIRQVFQARLVSKCAVGSVCASWLPHHHDMGLFGTILAPLTAGAVLVQMPPEAFLRRPSRWLSAISEHRADFAGAPNFGYAICNRRMATKSIAGLDLSNWRVAFLGGEPAWPETLETFASLTRSAGFRKEAYLNCYGLAEATLMCSAGNPIAKGAHLTSGEQVPGCRILLRPLPADIKADGGEICISGDHVSPGLWSPEPDGHTVPHKDLFEGPDGCRYLPTGDIGTFVDEQILVLERLKDILPVRGGSIGPNEIETLVLSSQPKVEAVAAVMSPDSRSESIHLAIEMNPREMTPSDCEAMISDIKTQIAEAYGVRIDVSLHPRGRLPRTTSGKIQRFATRQMIARIESPSGTDSLNEYEAAC
ncbi:MAG: AMP-binding protein [Gammaproteobacteria bacterium]